MPQTVLIVEDEQSAANVLSALCAEVGLSVRHTRSGSEAVRECAAAHQSGTPFVALILDLVLAESDGFQFAQAARAQPWGEKLPLLIVSGIYKQLPADFAAKTKPSAFFAKPFEPKAMREALSRITGATAGGGAVEGNVRQKPLAAVLVELLQKKATGTLTVQSAETKRLATIQQGMVRFAQSNLKAEAVGAAQVASGAIKQTSFDRAVALARQQGVSLHEALASARVMTPDQLKAALRQSTVDVCLGALALSDGTWKFEPRPPEAVNGVPDLRTSPVLLVLEAARRTANPVGARQWLEGRGQDRIARTPELERELFSLRASWPGESVSALATSGRTVAEVLARVKDSELPLFQMLCVSGLISLSGAARVDPRAAQAVAAAAAEQEDRGKTFRPQEETARRMLFAERDRLKDATHYEVLGIDPSASESDVKKAYIAAAKKFHSDGFSGMELGSARRVAEELFAKVGEASSVLSDKKKRAEYDVYVDRKAKGLPTDVAAILRAEGIFQKGEVQLKQGKWDDAEQSFREAIALNHAEAEFHAYLGMAVFRKTGKPEVAFPHVEKSLELDPRLKSGTLFAAQLAEASGDVDRAQVVLKKALQQDPSFAEAKDALRRLRNRPVQQHNKGGLLSRLLSKK